MYVCVCVIICICNVYVCCTKIYVCMCVYMLKIVRERKEMFYLMMPSAHFIYRCMASTIS